MFATRTARSIGTVSGLVLAGAAIGQHAHHAGTGELGTVHACWPADESGLLTGVTVLQEMDEGVLQRKPRLNTDNRYVFAIVGDGYTQAEQEQFHADATSLIRRLSQFEPFDTYRRYFKFVRVEVVSNESGVDNDPSRGVSRDTALDMGFWCNGVERLLCVNSSKAWDAALAGTTEDIDQVLAVANSSKYGGAGYPWADLATASGQNALSADIAIHELGHSIANLADEYETGGPTVYTGAEPGEFNVSLLTAPELDSLDQKWHRWLGHDGDARLDTPVGSYEGGKYSEFGIYRPTENSMMRSLGRPFNGPGAEKLIERFYSAVSPVESHTPLNQALPAGSVIEVVPMRPRNHALDLTWEINGVRQTQLDGAELVEVDLLGLGEGTYEVACTVRDNTTLVRDEKMRDTRMTRRLAWAVNLACDPPADLNQDGLLDLGDILTYVEWFLAAETRADLNADGVLDVGDIGRFIELYQIPC